MQCRFYIDGCCEFGVCIFKLVFMGEALCAYMYIWLRLVAINEESMLEAWLRFYVPHRFVCRLFVCLFCFFFLGGTLIFYGFKVVRDSKRAVCCVFRIHVGRFVSSIQLGCWPATERTLWLCCRRRKFLLYFDSIFYGFVLSWWLVLMSLADWAWQGDVVCM